ncbi:MAG TPA: cupredoxin domain-containing protein [Polyangiaceae bacterium]
MHKTTVLLLLTLAACNKKSDAPAAAADGRAEVRVTVDAVGYHPEETRAAAGKPVRLVVTRTTDEGCGQELVIPSLKLKRDLPLNQPVAVDLTMPASGKLAFTCGMDMMKGALVAQ